MMNEPTKRAMTAKTRRKVLKNAMSSFNAVLLLGDELGAGDDVRALRHDLRRPARPARAG